MYVTVTMYAIQCAIVETKSWFHDHPLFSHPLLQLLAIMLCTAHVVKNLCVLLSIELYNTSSTFQRLYLFNKDRLV